jgi:hypothetical protein
MTRRTGLVSIVLTGAVVASLVLWHRSCSDQRDLRVIAGRLLACSPEGIEILSSETSDTSELHRVRGCGREATVICSAPDFVCDLASEVRAP